MKSTPVGEKTKATVVRNRRLVRDHKGVYIFRFRKRNQLNLGMNSTPVVEKTRRWLGRSEVLFLDQVTLSAVRSIVRAL